MASPIPAIATVSEDELARCLDQTDTGALVLDTEGLIVAINPFLSGLLQHHAEELRGRPLASLGTVYPNPARLQQRLQKARAGLPYRQMLSLCSCDGVRLHFAFRWCGRVKNSASLHGLPADLLECQFEALQTPVLRDASDYRRRRQRVLDRRGFMTAVQQALEQARGEGVPCSMLSVSIDRLDPEDREAASQALRRVAETCAGLLRGNDRVGVLGFHGFGVLLPGTLSKGALQVAERLRAAIALQPTPVGAPCFTVSIGTVTSRTGRSAYQALRSRAEAKRDDARERGGNRVNG